MLSDPWRYVCGIVYFLWRACNLCILGSVLLKFGLSEKHTKFEKYLPHGFDKSADLLTKRQNHEEVFFKLCALLKKSELFFTNQNLN